jgi:hypothetical protein
LKIDDEIATIANRTSSGLNFFQEKHAEIKVSHTEITFKEVGFILGDI